jgi:D-alanine-D-alanine ligase-like ATP-grasp enzyme
VSSEAEISGDLSEKIKKYSKALADTFGIRHLARFDFLLSRDGRLIFNEINTFPGFTESSLYPKLIEKAGIAPQRLIEMLIYDSIA